MEKENSQSKKVAKTDKESQENSESQIDNETHENNKPQIDNETQENDQPKIDSKTLQFLLEQKLLYLNTVAKVCMSWWVSSIVFCGTILAAVWLSRKELVAPGILETLGCAVAGFFATFICFGIIAIQYLNRLKISISLLMQKLEPSASSKVNNTFNLEINSIKLGIIIGIFTFILILCVWIYLIYEILSVRYNI